MSFFFVRIETDDGVVGYGESCDSYGCSYAGVLAAVVDDAFAPLLHAPYLPRRQTSVG